MTVVAAADGSALGNPGPAGWGWYVDDDRWASGGWKHGTNNMGELTAVLDLLQQTADLDEDLLVLCDSQYAIKSITQWMPGWKRRGWKKGDGKPVANVEIIKALDAAMRPNVRFRWVKGHAGHELNEQADRLANAAAQAYAAGREPQAGPGFGAAAAPAEHPFVVGGGRADDDLFSLVDEPGDEDQVVALERSLLTEEVRSDPSLAAALLHPEWQEVGRSGRRWSREEMLDELTPLPAPVELEVLDVQRLPGDLVLLLWRGVGPDASTLRSSLWQRTGQRWQQRFHQGTPEA
ncbi:ribonuclease HI family protein [Serinicoccus chungangensis]|uniref:ribonuclease HI family protein n=1 Tax=Serinicoccus chungangensis TaxID=767452 RepID=UPI0011193025|nr:ribonuclease HI family protein [Serinicoccus chungangensis]